MIQGWDRRDDDRHVGFDARPDPYGYGTPCDVVGRVVCTEDLDETKDTTYAQAKRISRRLQNKCHKNSQEADPENDSESNLLARADVQPQK